MVKINNATSSKNGVVIEYETSGITISTLVRDADDLTPQEIVQKGFDEVKAHIEIECERVGIDMDMELPVVEDEVVSIELLGVNDVHFTEGQTRREQPLRCAGKTMYGKTINLTAMSEFTPSNPLMIEPTESTSETVTVTYGNLISHRGFMVNYKTLAEIESERVAAEIARLEQEQELKNLPPTVEEEVAEIKMLLADLVSITLGV